MRKIAIKADGTLFMTMEPGNPLENNVIVSCSLVRGRWPLGPELGVLHDHDNLMTSGVARLVEKRYTEALAWLLKTGRARAVSVKAEETTSDGTGGLMVHVDVTGPDNEPVKYETFVRVG